MDIIENCRSYLNNQLRNLNGYIDQHVNPNELAQTQTRVDAAIRDKHTDLDLIFEQQCYVKGLIDKDERVLGLRRQMREDKRTIDELRRACKKVASDAIRNCHLIEAEQSKELEKFQLNLMKNIIEDQQRHKRILEQREHELASIKAEFEREESNRANVIVALEKSLEKQIQDRRRQAETGHRPIASRAAGPSSSITDELFNPDHVELMTVDEYEPFGSSRPDQPAPRKRTRGGGTGGRGGARGRGSTRGRRGGRVA